MALAKSSLIAVIFPSSAFPLSARSKTLSDLSSLFFGSIISPSSAFPRISLTFFSTARELIALTALLCSSKNIPCSCNSWVLASCLTSPSVIVKVSKEGLESIRGTTRESSFITPTPAAANPSRNIFCPG